MASNKEQKCKQCVSFQTAKCPAPEVEAEDVPCNQFSPKTKKKNDEELGIKPEDLNELVDVKPALISPAGGFTENFAYEGFWTLDKSGKKVWGIIYDTGTKRDIVIACQDKWLKKVLIEGTYYKIINPPLLEYSGTWNLKNVLEYKEHGTNLDPKQVFNDIIEIIKYFVDLDYGTPSVEGKYVTIACWVICTYFYELFPMFPYIVATGFRASGKTQLVSSTVFQSYHATLPSGLPTISAMFREIETCKPTMFLDNAEQYYEHDDMSEENKSIVTMLDMGAYAYGSVPRVEGDSKERYITKYRIYCPKCITTIMGVTQSVESRSINFNMINTIKKEYANRSPELKIAPQNPNDTKAAQIQTNRNNMYALRMKLWRQVQEKYNQIKNDKYNILNRDWDCWHPIFTIAEIFCPDKIPQLLKFVEENVKLNKDNLMDEEKEKAIKALAMLRLNVDKLVPIQDFAIALQNLKQQTDPYYTLTGKQAGNILRSLGFIERDKNEKGQRCFKLNKKLLERHAADVNVSLEDEPDQTVITQMTTPEKSGLQGWS